MAQADGSLTQTVDVHHVKLLGTSWLVHVAYTANELAALHLNVWLAFTLQHFAAAFRVLLKLSTFPNSTCIDLLLVIKYAVCAVCLKYFDRSVPQHRSVSTYIMALAVASSSTCFAAAAKIYNNNNQQQQHSRSIPPIPNTLTLSYPLPC